MPVLRLVQKLWPHLITLWNAPGTGHCGIVLGYKPLCLFFAACSKNLWLTLLTLLPSQFITGHGHSGLSVPSTFHNTISTGLSGGRSTYHKLLQEQVFLLQRCYYYTQLTGSGRKLERERERKKRKKVRKRGKIKKKGRKNLLLVLQNA